MAATADFDRDFDSTAPASRWRNPLIIGLACSVLLHAFIMAVRFAPPEPILFKPYDSQIEVVLLNAKTDTQPLTPEVLAQVSQVGGGDNDQGRAKSPLVADTEVRDGDEVQRSARRQSELEAQQRQLMALAAKTGPNVTDPARKSAETSPSASSEDQQTTQAISRLQAQIDQQISDYNKRPKRLTYGVNAKGVSYARYVDDWADRIERIGTDRFPAEARGKMYDSLICTVEIDKFGMVTNVVINQPSKFPVLNRAVKQIVFAGAPYPRFPQEMAKDGDILQIVRTWTFTTAGLATTAAQAPGAATPDSPLTPGAAPAPLGGVAPAR